MPRHVVERGDTLLRIASRFGHVNWRKIYNHPQNASLKERRPDPGLLVAGDIVFVPEIEPKHHKAPTDARHRFRLKGTTALCRIVVQDESGRSLAGERFELCVDAQTLTGTIGANGAVELEVAPDPRMGKLTVWQTEPERILSFTLGLGHLEPISTMAGVKARLRNLGFEPGDVFSDRFDKKAKAALHAFQVVAALPASGELDAATSAALADAHDQG